VETLEDIALAYLDDEVFYSVLINIIHRNLGTVLAASDQGVLLRTHGKVAMISSANTATAQAMLESAAVDDCRTFVVCEEPTLNVVEQRYGFQHHTPVNPSAYLGDPLPVIHRPDLRIDTLSPKWGDWVADHYGMDNPRYVRSRVEAGEVWGLFHSEEILGFIGLHEQGSMGMLEILEEHRRQGYAEYLLTFLTNKLLAEGVLPHDHIIVGNEASVRLQQKLDFTISDRTLWWVS
jgi:ribosomal protein S18 acetylase RimI-like enzyme